MAKFYCLRHGTSKRRGGHAEGKLNGHNFRPQPNRTLTHGPGHRGLAVITSVPMGTPVYRYSHQIITLNHPRARGARRISEKVNFSKFFRCHEKACQSAFRGFSEANSPGYVGLAATTWAPMGARAPVSSPNDHPNTSQRRQKVFGKVNFSKTLQPTHANMKTAKSSPAGPHRADLGKSKIAPRTPVIGLGVHREEKSGMGPGSKSTHSGGHSPNQVLTPAHPTPSKEWYPGTGG